MRKALALLLFSMLLAGFAGCGGEKPAAASTHEAAAASGLTLANGASSSPVGPEATAATNSSDVSPDASATVSDNALSPSAQPSATSNLDAESRQALDDLNQALKDLDEVTKQLDDTMNQIDGLK